MIKDGILATFSVIENVRTSDKNFEIVQGILQLGII